MDTGEGVVDASLGQGDAGHVGPVGFQVDDTRVIRPAEGEAARDDIDGSDAEGVYVEDRLAISDGYPIEQDESLSGEEGFEGCVEHLQGRFSVVLLDAQLWDEFCEDLFHDGEAGIVVEQVAVVWFPVEVGRVSL